MKALIILVAALGLFAWFGIAKLAVSVAQDGQLTTITQRVNVIYPPTWAVNEYRNCQLQGPQQLDCFPERPQYVRPFVIDVQFSGKRDQPLTYWTCQNTSTGLVCKNLPPWGEQFGGKRVGGQQ